jgi:biotin carboxylase
VEGVSTTAPFIRRLLDHPDTARAPVHTTWLEDVFLSLYPPKEP